MARRHDPPFKPAGSVGAFRAPGVPSLVCQNQGPGPRAGECGAACSSGKEKKEKPREGKERKAIQLSSNLLPSKAASPCGRPVFPSTVCVPTTWCANDGAVDSTTSTPVIESTATRPVRELFRHPSAEACMSDPPTPVSMERGDKKSTAIPEEEKADGPSILPMTPESKQRVIRSRAGAAAGLRAFAPVRVCAPRVTRRRRRPSRRRLPLGDPA